MKIRSFREVHSWPGKFEVEFNDPDENIKGTVLVCRDPTNNCQVFSLGGAQSIFMTKTADEDRGDTSDGSAILSDSPLRKAEKIELLEYIHHETNKPYILIDVIEELEHSVESIFKREFRVWKRKYDNNDNSIMITYLLDVRGMLSDEGMLDND